MNKKESTAKNLGLSQDQLYESVGTELPKGLEMTVDMESALPMEETGTAVYQTLQTVEPELLVTTTKESTDFPDVDSVNQYVQELDSEYYAQIAEGRKRGLLGNLKLYAKRAVKSVKNFIDPMHDINRAVEEQEESPYVKAVKDVVTAIDNEYYRERAARRQRGLLTNLKLHAGNAWQGLKTLINPMKSINEYADKMEALEVPPMPAAPEVLSPSEKLAANKTPVSRKEAAKATLTAMSQLHDFYRKCSNEGINIRDINEDNLHKKIAELGESPIVAELPGLLETKRQLSSAYEKANDVLERVRSGETVLNEDIVVPTTTVRLSVVPAKKSLWKRAGTALAAAAGIVTAALGGMSDTNGRLNNTKLNTENTPDESALPTVVAPVKLVKHTHYVEPKIVAPQPELTKPEKTVTARAHESRKIRSYDSLAARMKANRRIAVIKSRLGKSPSSGLPVEVWSRASSMMDDATTYLHAADTSCGINGLPGVCPPDKGKTASEVVTEAYIVPVEKMLSNNGISLLR